MQDIDDKMTEHVECLQKVLSKFVGIQCCVSWTPLDRQNKKESDLRTRKEWDLFTASSLSRRQNAGSMRGIQTHVCIVVYI